MIISKPINVDLTITDVDTGCSYNYSGASTQECVDYYLSMFIGRKRFITSFSATTLNNICNLVSEGISKEFDLEESYEYKEDIDRIIRVLSDHGFKVNRGTAENIWIAKSDREGASWLCLPENAVALWEEICYNGFGISKEIYGNSIHYIENKVNTVTTEKAAQDLLDKICLVDKNVKTVMCTVTEAKINTLKTLQEGFDGIVSLHPELIEDIQRRIVEYHTCNDPSKIRKITDFVHLPQWYSWSFKDENPIDYWDPSGKYYGLRMNEVINMFLLAEQIGE